MYTSSDQSPGEENYTSWSDQPGNRKSNHFNASILRRSQISRRKKGCLLISLLIVSLLGLAVWTNLIPIHTGPIRISVGLLPTLYIHNNARNQSEFRQRDAAPLHIHAGGPADSVLINAQNLPFIGALPITYRQSADHTIIFIDVDYRYRGSIDITVPTHTNIKLDSYENDVEIEGLTGRILLDTYDSTIQVTNCILTGPSLVTNYTGSITLQQVTLKSGSAFQSYGGDITFQGTLAPQGHHFFSSYQGKLALTIPANSTFSVDASTYRHTITTDFPGLHPDEQGLQGSVGQSPQVYLHLSTYNNDITLQRGKEA